MRDQWWISPKVISIYNHSPSQRLTSELTQWNRAQFQSHPSWWKSPNGNRDRNAFPSIQENRSFQSLHCAPLFALLLFGLASTIPIRSSSTSMMMMIDAIQIQRQLQFIMKASSSGATAIILTNKVLLWFKFFFFFFLGLILYFWMFFCWFSFVFSGSWMMKWVYRVRIVMDFIFLDLGWCIEFLGLWILIECGVPWS